MDKLPYSAEIYNSMAIEKTVLPFLLNEDDGFGQMANQDIASLPAPLRDCWYDFLRLVDTAKGGKPTAKLLTQAKKMLPVLGKQELLTRMDTWMNYLIGMEFTQVSEWYGYFISSNNIATIKGLVWSLSLVEIDSLHGNIERLIIRCFKKIPGLGPASGALGNACIYTIANKESLPNVALLNRVRSKIAQRNTKGLIDRYISAIAEKLQISISDLEDFSIDDFGLIKGVKEVAFKDYTARLTLVAFGKTQLEWIKPDGKLQKSVPAFVRKDFAAELKELRSVAKLIPKTLSIQRDRLDRSYVQKRNFPFPHFQKYYLEHGLMSFLTEKLIWVFRREEQVAHAIWEDGQWQDIAGDPVDWVDEETTVQLWHPLQSNTEDILRWRDYLQVREIKQPLKQAYREVYILTEAEIRTRTYSNRMAAHILKQHQFNALAGIRGWRYQLLGVYDDGREGEICSMDLPDYNLKAEYWINEVNAEDAFNDTGIWLYVATDQIRFTQEENTVNLIDIPQIIFSEVMRDVDLFVGVGSVGNDPAWQDNGGLPQFQTYWESYSFGNLTEVAKTRKVILEKLLPRLKIAKVSSIQGKFLVVKGTKRTYKIHIGSTNILMEPNDQYLCIVPARSSRETKKDKLFIPFEGDRGLSILLSKAFLLAEDDQITDTTITMQIEN